ncbi:MAG: SURF1 family protein [Dermatophilaceae bacterium]
MIRTLLTRRWLTALAAAIAFCIVCLFLGRWQYERFEEKSAAATAVRAHIDTAPIPLDAVLPSGRDLPKDAEWTRVEVRGTYAPGPPLMVRNRPQNVTYGFEALDPLRLPDGTALLVDRGWVRNGPNAQAIPDVPTPPAETLTVTGWLRQGEPSLDREMPGRLLASINLQEAAEKSGLTLRGAYLILDSENDGSGRAPARPTPLLPPDTDTGPHFGYALQWWAGSVAGFVVVFVYLRREVRENRAAGAPTIAAGDDPRGARQPAGVAMSKPRKTRIWDEEDE